MFAVQVQPSWVNFQPPIPSPLSARSLNACYGTNHPLPMSFPSKSPPRTDPSKRPSKYNVLNRNKETERDKRRDLFLRKVKNLSDDKKWEARIDQVEMRDFREEQQRFEEELARSAPEVPEDEEMDVDDQAAFEQELLSQQEQELEALFSALDNDQQGEHQERSHSPTDYGSDDEEYDRLLLEMLNQKEVEVTDGSTHFGMFGTQDMDTGAG